MFAVSSSAEVSLPKPSCVVRVKLNNFLLEPSEIIEDLALRQGPLDVYCWYEGPQGLPRSAAIWWRDFLFQPLVNRKRDAMFCLYCLKGWDFAKPVSKLADSPLGKAIQQIDSVRYRCLYAASFFKDCALKHPTSPLYQFTNQEMPKKSWLAALSNVHKPRQKSVAEFFDGQTSLFDAIGKMDINHAYSYMQYMEGYYLIQESIKKGLSKKQEIIQIAFVMPNDENKYYRDMPEDLGGLLSAEFGDALNGVEIHVSFLSFRFGDGLKDRPYIEKGKQVIKITPQEVGSYLPLPSAGEQKN